MKYLGRDTNSLFSVFIFKLWPDREARGEFMQYGDEEVEKLLNLPILNIEEFENAQSQCLDLEMVVSRKKNSSLLLETYENLLCPNHDMFDCIKHILQLG